MWWCELYSCWITQDVYNQSAYEEDSLPLAIEAAKKDWLYAEWYFNFVTDHDLVDYAIYLIKASELKYTYLLKKAKQEGVKFSRYVV